MRYIDRYIDDYCNNRHIEFVSRCSNANINIEVMQWNVYTYHELNVCDHAFRVACAHGNIEFARWLLSIKPDIDVSAENEWAFIRSCTTGHLEIAQLVYATAEQRGKPVNLELMNFTEFGIICAEGYLDVAQWVLSVKPDIDVSAEDDILFYWACICGKLDVAKWILTLNPNMNVSIFDDCAFRCACSNGHLEVAKWIWTINPDTNVSAKCNYAFHYECINKHMEVEQWLLTICPDLMF